MGKFLKIGLGLLLVGAGIVAVFAAISKDSVFAITNDDDYTYHEVIYNSDDFSDITFDIDNRSIYVLPSTDDKVKIEYYDTEKNLINSTMSEGKLSLMSEKSPWYENLIFSGVHITNDEIFKVYLYLPTITGTYDLNLTTSNGEMSIKDVESVYDLYFHTSNGKIICENLDINKFIGTTSNGDVSFTGVTLDTILDISTSNGRMYFTNVSGDELDGNSSNGKIVATNIEFNNIELDTSNGSITAQVIGSQDDYRIHIDTSNGDLTLDGIKVDQEDFNTSLTNKVDLSSSNGSIDLDFTE